MIEFQQVRFAFDRAPVLNDITLGIGAGELLCVVGKNGAGKSTLLRLAAGLLAPNHGTVRAFGAPAHTANRAALARRLSYLPQSYELAFPFRVLEVVLMGRYPHARGVFDLESPRDLEQARAAMARCDITALEGRRFHELSGGEKRRTLLAQALCQESELVLLDEPTAALDPGHACAFFETLRTECARRLAAVVVTHDLNLAVRYASRVVVLHAGSVAADAPPASLMNSDVLARAFDVPLHTGSLPSGQPFVVPS